MFRIGEIRSPIPQPQDISISSQVKHMENANHERLIFVIVDPGRVTKSRSKYVIILTIIFNIAAL